MTIRLNGLSIAEELLEKLHSLSFENTTSITFSAEEVYLCKLMADSGLSVKDISPSFIYDIDAKCIRIVSEYKENTGFKTYNGVDSGIITDIEKAFVLPAWNEARTWLLNKGFKMDFHYDPFFKEENIKMGFMKPKSATVSDNIIIEVEGKSDLEAIYKVILEVLKYEKENPPNIPNISNN